MSYRPPKRDKRGKGDQYWPRFRRSDHTTASVHHGDSRRGGPRGGGGTGVGGGASGTGGGLVGAGRGMANLWGHTPPSPTHALQCTDPRTQTRTHTHTHTHTHTRSEHHTTEHQTHTQLT